jgi:RNAse (barnase) inhibitor barstar
MTDGFVQVADPRQYAQEARKQNKLVVWIPRGIRSKEKLFGILSDALRFPAYFGGNWDALEECLQDLSWLPENASIVIVHEQLPFGDSNNRATYFSILDSASLARRDGRQIEVAALG